jgi:hypothetical protein
MASSQNGWPVVTDRALLDNAPYNGVTLPNGVLAGDVATIARWQTARYAATVEALKPGHCWGWLVRKIEGSSTWSNHSSATAWDLNAPEHPMGLAPEKTMSPAQIEACHAIERASDGVLRWGGDFSRPDSMHWEIVGTPDQCRVFATTLTRKITRMKIQTSYPDIGQSDGDAELPGYNTIVRIQRIVQVTDDGWWGPKTTAGIAKFVALPVSSCRKLTEEIFRKIFGLPDA